jgi:hypothetical protein
VTPIQKLQYLMLVADGRDVPYQAEEIDRAVASYWDIGEAYDKVRSTGISTGLPSPYSRHYEAREVAQQLPDDSWVGWTYWYGGGKHGNPEEVEWMEHAYDVHCVEEQKLMTVRTFTIVGNNP